MKTKQLFAQSGYLFLVNFLRVILILSIMVNIVFILAVIAEFTVNNFIILIVSLIVSGAFYFALLNIRKNYLNEFPAAKTEADIEEKPEDIDLDIKCSCCGSDYVEPMYKSYLCYDCRTSLSTRKIPVGVIIFSAVMILISITGYYNINSRVADKISYERALRDIKESRYSEAESEFLKIADKFPENKFINGYLFVAQVHTQKYEEALKSYKKLEGKKIYNKELAEEINKAADLMLNGGK